MNRRLVLPGSACLVFSSFTLVACQGTTSGGGATGTGGAMSTPAVGTGGATGATATGGSAGPTATGGTTPTGAGTGGRVNTAGTTGTGGAARTGGTTGTGGSTGVGGTGPISAGCSATTFPPGDQMYTIDVAGVTRQYIVGLPAGYSPGMAHPLVFAWHGRTGTAQQIAGTGTRGYYGLRSQMTNAIFVAGQGLGTDADPADTGWPNTGGRDIAFVRAMIGWLTTNYCVDQTRIFSTGMSYGGIMSHTIGCQMSDVFRAIGPMAGMMIGGRGNTCLTHPIAAWMTHGTADTAAIGGVDYANGVAARDRILTLNHCGTTTVPVTPSPCVSYDGCDAGYPVHWCSHDGAHIIPTFAAGGIATFFLQF